jgi:hypothetical protein
MPKNPSLVNFFEPANVIMSVIKRYTMNERKSQQNQMTTGLTPINLKYSFDFNCVLKQILLEKDH